MTNLEIAEFLGTKCNTIDEVIAFLEGDCGVVIRIDHRTKIVARTDQDIFVEGEPTEFSFTNLFFSYQRKNFYTIYSVSETKIKEVKKFSQNLMPLLTPKEKNKVIEVIHGIKERSKPAKASGGKGGNINIEVSPTITAQASANAQNTIDIKNLSELSTYVTNNIAITNKAEIQKAISDLEEAKDGDSAESYIGLLIKLVGLLCKDGILPPFVGKLVDGLGKWV